MVAAAGQCCIEFRLLCQACVGCAQARQLCWGASLWKEPCWVANGCEWDCSFPHSSPFKCLENGEMKVSAPWRPPVAWDGWFSRCMCEWMLTSGQVYFSHGHCIWPSITWSTIQFSTRFVLPCCVCVVHSDARAVSRVRKPLRLAGVADMTSSHNRAFILPTVKRLQGFQGALTKLGLPSEPTPCLRLTNLRFSKSFVKALAVWHLYLVHFLLLHTEVLGNTAVQCLALL